MKKALLPLALAAAALFALMAGVLFAIIYARDSKTIERVKEVILRVDHFCLERGQLPAKEEFTTLFPDLATSAGWFYWPMPDRVEARIQYPMSSRHLSAPGTPKTSEFTATTYAYITSVKCSR